MHDPFTEDLGVYVGPATLADTLKALNDHTPGEWVARLRDPDGETLWHRNGWSWYFTENDEAAVLAIGDGQGAGSPAMFVDALVLHFTKEIGLAADGPRGATECSQYTGGLSFTLGFGEWAGHTLDLLAWHSVLHETETGDIAPGFGGFRATVEDAG